MGQNPMNLGEKLATNPMSQCPWLTKEKRTLRLNISNRLALFGFSMVAMFT